ncbi:PucR family transcriptional regulator [Paenibacillus xerothermodurans]|uniref:PucR family transcriptional regulator n=1 Tax=Paenibacillus xerothermodurans TaxID=1977292 RepID=A0A2W1N649_PAEXE|nr:helix-turn-helix domain-containing protein [Paenibacillus xerothermodurans]PZE19294.1 PucR family transcriptional regulator [Paenibacillus xerothermodurans]
MDWEPLRKQLEEILGVPIHLSKMSGADWVSRTGQTAQGKRSVTKSMVADGDVLFFVEKQGDAAVILSVAARSITPTERQLVELMLESRLAATKNSPEVSDDERTAVIVRDWFKRQQELGLTHAELPDSIVTQLSLYSTKIPLLLYGDYSQPRRVSYKELKKLLESFFDSELTLIPLMDKEWLILGSERLLTMGTTDDRDLEEECLEDTLASIGHGLHEMLENEWVGECHLAVSYPTVPAKSLYSTVLQLRETMMLGRTYHVGNNIHFPWQLQLEKLINLIPEADKTQFLERVLKRLDAVLDTETTTTLEHFFQLDCNVSETAKKLYIHRNTLLYRLDKFKQETGLDVRTFNDAVLVKIALLLYKVTKRN